MKATVTEIHDYPHRPQGFAEPLFWGPGKKHEMMEHFLEAPWLGRASELGATGGSGETAHVMRESIRLRRGDDGTRFLERRCERRHRRRVWGIRSVLGCWREVRGWWASEGCDLVLYRLLLSDGAVVDVAKDLRDLSGEGWKLVGVVD